MREPFTPQMTAEEFLRWAERQEDKFELHHGFAIAFAGGTLDHDGISYNLRRIFDRLYRSPCKTFGSDVRVRVAEAVYYYCDAGVVCEPVEGGASVIERPRVVAEVLSRATRAYDLVEKRAAYRALPQLEAYAIVHSAMRRAEVDSRSPAGAWKTVTYDDDETFIAGFSFTLDKLYARTSLANQ